MHKVVSVVRVQRDLRSGGGPAVSGGTSHVTTRPDHVALRPQNRGCLLGTGVTTKTALLEIVARLYCYSGHAMGGVGRPDCRRGAARRAAV